MSWIERVKNDLTITTGDGNNFSPVWKGATLEVEYNVKEFNYPNIEGSKMERRLPRGRRYSLEFWFQGDAHIDVTKAFELSARDPRFWTISHPYYDQILVQPLSLSIDQSDYNVSKLRVPVIETILDINPKTDREPSDAVAAQKLDVDSALISSFTGITFEANNVTDLRNTNDVLFEEGKKIVVENEDFEIYFNAYNIANSSISNALNDSIDAIKSIQDVINAPSDFSQSVQERYNLYERQLIQLFTTIDSTSTVISKRAYEANSSSLMSATCTSLVSNIDFNSRSEVISYIERLLSLYDDFIDVLDSISDDDHYDDNYLPDWKSQFNLNKLINFTVSNLFSIAIDARQERFIFLEKDSNIIILTHRFIGLDLNDEKLENFIKINNIGLNEILGLKKEREIVYFV